MLNALKLEKNELAFQFNENKRYLDKFRNSVNMFSYPYGQPDVYFNQFTNSILENLDVKYIFAANPIINSKYKENIIYPRLPIHEYVNSNKKMCNHIGISKIKKLFRYGNKYNLINCMFFQELIYFESYYNFSKLMY